MNKWKIITFVGIAILVVLLLFIVKMRGPSTIKCYDDNECFLNSLTDCSKATYIMSNVFVGTQQATILREANNGCEVRYIVRNNAGQEIKDVTCIVSKHYKPKHMYLTDGMCNS